MSVEMYRDYAYTQDGFRRAGEKKLQLVNSRVDYTDNAPIATALVLPNETRTPKDVANDTQLILLHRGFHRHPDKVDLVTKLPALTDDELLDLIYNARGFKVKDIRRKFGKQLSHSQKSIYEKYNVENATQAVSLAIKHQVILPELFQRDFDLAGAQDLDDTQVTLLRELTNTEDSNSNEAIGQRMTPILSKQTVNSTIAKIYRDFGIATRPQAAAYYLLAERKGALPKIDRI